MKHRLPNVAHIKWGKNMRWRATVSVEGKTHNGPVRETQEEAYADAQGIKATRAAISERGARTLGEALSLVTDDADFRGVAPLSVEGVYAAPGRSILRYIPPSTPMRAISVETVCDLVRRSLKDGRSTVTVKKGYLRVLRLAFKFAKVPSPVEEARKLMATALKDTPPIPKWFEPAEFGRLLQRVRDVERGDAQRVHDLIAVLGYTGIRSGEFSRVRVRDVEIDRAHLHVRTAKDRRRPRTQPLPAQVIPCLRRLCFGLKADEPLVTGSELNHSMYRYQKLLSEPRLNGRAIRHSYGTGLVMQGATLPEVRDLLGHHPHSRATNRYLHSLESHRQAAVTRLSDAYESGEPSSSSAGEPSSSSAYGAEGTEESPPDQ